MDDWELEPARDLDLAGVDRYRSHRRENGLISSTVRLGWWMLLRGTFRSWNRLRVLGREHLPGQPPFVLVANHASHLDALLLACVLPLRWRDQTFPIAARDVFFEKHSLAAFAATVFNAMPVYRGTTGRHGLADLRERLQGESCIYMLFPEGTRTRDGTMSRFKPGIGMLVAGTTVPVVPCHIAGAFHAMPPDRWFLRPARLEIRLGAPQAFAELPNEREGWDACAQRLEEAVRSLQGPDGSIPAGARAT